MAYERSKKKIENGFIKKISLELKQKNNIDNFFKEKLEHRTFELKDSFIADLEQKLDERKKKRRGYFFLIFLFIGILPFGYYIFNVHNDNKVLEKVEPSSIEQEINSIAKKERVVIQKEKQEELNVVDVNKVGEDIENKDKIGLENNDGEQKQVSKMVALKKKNVSKGVANYIRVNSSNTNTSNYRLMSRKNRFENYEEVDDDNSQLESILLNKKTSKKESYRQLKRRESKEQIEELREGTLLVRLKTSNNKINALEKVGNIKKSLKVKEEQDLENKKIIAAFKNHFSFCDVVFFHSNHSDNVRDKKMKNIFLNDSLEIDGSIEVDTSKAIFIAEFTNIEQEHSDLGFYALVIKDDDFVQLKKPFPYYARASYEAMKQHPEQAIFLFPTLPFQNESVEATVKDMNEKLHDYFIKVQ